MAFYTKPNCLFKMPFPLMGIIVCGLPLIAAFVCVVWSLIYDFKKSTATHCRVQNYLPSISAAIGDFTPQRYVWRVCIALHATPRFMVAVSYYNFHTSVHVGKNNELYKSLAALTSFCHIVEVTSLVGLTYISSTENHDIHRNFFILFMAAGIVYMMLTIYLYGWGRLHSGVAITHEESMSLLFKKIMFYANVSIFLLSVYIYNRHNTYCETGVYTYFAACEYAIVVTNILFHLTAALDFKASEISLVLGGSSEGLSCTRTGYSYLPR